MSKKLVENNTDLLIDETSDDSNLNVHNKNKKVVRKIGRTILIKLLNDISTFDMKLLDDLEGLTNKTEFNTFPQSEN